MADPSMHQFFFSQLLPIKQYSSSKCDQFKEEHVKIGTLEFSEKNPENHVEDVAESQKFVALEKMFPLACQVPMEADPFKQLTALQVKLYNTERKLRLTRRKMKETTLTIDREWKELERKENELRENFILFNKFVVENNEKRARAFKKIEDDNQMTQQRQDDINNLKEKMQKMARITAWMENNAKKFKCYKEFLQEVLDASSFNSTNALIDRYQSLMLARTILVKREGNNINVLEYAKLDMMKLIEEKNFVIMGLNNQIANLQARYENANIKALESEELVTQIKNNAVKQLGEIDTVKNSIWNVYVHMTLSKKHPIKIKKDNVEEQMMYINRTLTELNKVNKLIKKRATKATK